MSVDAFVFWLFVAAWAVVLALIALQIPRIVGEIRRGIAHAVALVEQSPLPLQLAKAEADLDRLMHAGDALPALQARAEMALDVIRTTPRFPPALRSLGARVQTEIAAFRAAR